MAALIHFVCARTTRQTDCLIYQRSCTGAARIRFSSVAFDRVANATGELRERYASCSLPERQVMAVVVSRLLKDRFVADSESERSL
jgi:hypothetical protein